MHAHTNVAVECTDDTLSKLVDSAREGHDIVITRGGRPVAKIVAITSPNTRVVAGYAKGTVVQMSDDFDDSISDFDEAV